MAPSVVLYRAGPQTARLAGSLRGHDHSRQSSATPKPLRRPRCTVHAVNEEISSARSIDDALLATRYEPYITLVVNPAAGNGKAHALFKYWCTKT